LNVKILVACFLMACAFISCAAKQVMLQSQLTMNLDGANIVFELKEDITIKASNAKPTTLKSGTHWINVGMIEQGTVYKTKDQVVIVNSFNVHEGYIVVTQDNVVGYYLPVEKTFVETKPVIIKLSKKAI